ncbi:hypothetical protein B0I72DRAFT_152386 [Yarrowia lipolytica]|jgi:large subunit ribosomal protein L25|uniref:YALI0D23155p n=2 Tax=Yarrowia lipolytica TaxID=4952 RepID=Q6C834_YARLI|nr:YALI0D23155p [Yarrowia lipolytica CLIB122]AOW04506.1 hypothetical protein YALI1_D29852g [Yarrowia lipolytica]KAB8285694.1 hypothetical protein BKA91DRAFT_92621 [Yarrowia lipolytica]KAE8172569.1 hypothetical protein BKA90DRAFT_168243 [Yarrowia lipolytica]KAJ8054037.1 hypothetical protein LXG23DRAFT_21193 [Yarrowia lipolytica]QNP98238.1 54S ribosomal protein L25 [Yarrowia lipolytica]|eukprot:XP_503178.1 YALI0D23155p [Yarrowia lipolytica CLIB122]
MKPSVNMLKQAVSSAVKAQVPVIDASPSYIPNANFAKLPQKLQDFFQRFPPQPFVNYSAKKGFKDAPNANPFLPNKSRVTNKTHKPLYSLRRQSDLYKLAHKHGVHELLPPMEKTFFETRHEQAKPLIGEMVWKKHIREKTKESRKEKIAKALETMDEKIAEAKGKKHWERLERREREKKQWV